MRSFIVVLMFALTACNGSDTTPVVAGPTLAQFQAAQAQIDALNKQMKQLQLIGHVNGGAPVSRDTRSIMAMQGEPTITKAVSFGPCADMGVLQGRGGSDTGSPLSSQFETYKTCMGYTYSISSLTGLLDVPPFLTWDGPNCTGNAYLEMDVPQNTMNADAVKNGIVFQSPIDATVVYEIPAGEQPQQIMIQSAINTRGGICGADQEVRLVVHAISNNISVTGIPNSMIPGTWTTGAP